MNDYVIVSDQYCRPLWTGKRVNPIAAETICLAPDTYIVENRSVAMWGQESAKDVTNLILVFTDPADAEFLMRLLHPLPDKMLFFIVSATTGDDLARYKLNVYEAKRGGPSRSTVMIEGHPIQ